MLHSSLRISELEKGSILAPERYDQRRTLAAKGQRTVDDFANIINEQISPKSADPTRLYVVIDTGDAQEGILRATRSPGKKDVIGSNKKTIHAGDVIISRLRPYLRQVAYVDKHDMDKDIMLLCSTEFIVLRSSSDESISFLVPYLLTEEVQRILAAAQEGGHHPRFGEKTLTSLPIPNEVIANRETISKKLMFSIERIKEGDLRIKELIKDCSSSFKQ